jgi:hypothetical protein
MPLWIASPLARQMTTHGDSMQTDPALSRVPRSGLPLLGKNSRENKAIEAGIRWLAKEMPV